MVQFLLLNCVRLCKYVIHRTFLNCTYYIKLFMANCNAATWKFPHSGESYLIWSFYSIALYPFRTPAICRASTVFLLLQSSVSWLSGWILFSISVTFTGDDCLTLTWAVLHRLLSTARHKLLMVVRIWTHSWLLSHITLQWGHLETISEGPKPSVCLSKEGIQGDMNCRKPLFWI